MCDRTALVGYLVNKNAHKNIGKMTLATAVIALQLPGFVL